MNAQSRDTARKPLMSRRVNRLLTVRTLIEALRSAQLAEYEIVDRDEKVARALGPRRFDVLSQEMAEDREVSESDRWIPPAAETSRGRAIRHLRQLEVTLNQEGALRCERLAANLRRFARLLALNETELRLLDFSVRLHNDLDLQDAVSQLDSRSHLVFTAALARILNDRRDRITQALTPSSRLLQSGVVGIVERSARAMGSRHTVAFEDLNLLPGLSEALLAPSFDFERIFSPFFRRCTGARLSLEQFRYLGDVVDVARALLAGAGRKGAPGVQILLYGAPGTGKTELAHALAEAIGKPLYAVASGGVSGAPYSREERYGCFRLAQQALRSRRGALVLFDEIEDVMSDPPQYTLAPRHQKGWTNQMLETNPVPSIWITNQTGHIDPAFLRRFSLIVHVDRPPRSVRREICATYLQDLPIEENVLARLADADDITPADLDRARRAMDMAPDLCSEPTKASRAVTTLLSSGPRAPERSALLPKAGFRLPEFDPALINTDLDLEGLVAGLGRSGEGRLCLYGLPGTGKTAFARYVAERLDRELITVSASSWLDPFVGMTERKMRESFERAARNNAILFVDEADSFLRDRSLARQSWEATQVNELLKCLEDSHGVVAFATNDFDVLDPAVLRRLDIKAAFRPLNREQSRTMFERTLEINHGDYSNEEHRAGRLRLDSLTGLVPGDFIAACRRLYVSGRAVTPRHLVDALDDELRIRTQHQGTGMGFTAPVR